MARVWQSDKVGGFSLPLRDRAVVEALAAGPGVAELSGTELSGLAAELEALLDDVRRRIALQDGEAPVCTTDGALDAARKFYNDRQRRCDLFGSDLFGEPAWDMLLDLYIAACEDRLVSTTSACIGANVPVATGLRWLQVLEARGLISRKADSRDARRVWIALTATARRQMRRYFAQDVEGGADKAQRSVAAA